jgi:hypothetical protein
MKHSTDLRQSALGLLCVIAIACGGSTAAPSSPAELGTTSCDRYVAALLGVKCSYGPVLPASEVARLQQTFAPVCKNAKKAPGSTLADAQLDACARALEAQCQLNGAPPLDACTFQGSLAAGEPCNAGPQCQSGVCGLPQSGTALDGGASDGGLPPGACGVCVAPAATGQPCPYGVCTPGASCVPDSASTQLQFICAADAPGGPQGPCGQATGACQVNLVCDTDSGLCEQTQSVGAGAACADSAGVETRRCNPGLYCAASGTCTSPLPAGHSCDTRSDVCQLGLACLGGDCTIGRCTEPTLVDDGQSATTPTSFCLHRVIVGCGGGGVCPALIPNGQPCDPLSMTGTCDDFSQCVNGTCQVVDSLGCQSTTH